MDKQNLSQPLMENENRAHKLHARIKKKKEGESITESDIEEFALEKKFENMEMTLDSIVAQHVSKASIDQRLKLSERYQFAFSHIVDALNKRYTKFDSSAWRRKIHQIYNNDWTSWTYIALILVHMSFVVFERPSFRATKWQFKSAEVILLSIELVIVILYFLLTFLQVYVLGGKFFRSPSRMLTIMVIITMFIDICIELSGIRIFRFSRGLRPVLLVLKAEFLRRAFKALYKTVYALRHLLFVLFFMLNFFAIFGVLFLGPRFKDPHFHHLSFKNFGYSSLMLFLAITFENYPEVIFPATHEAGYTIIYFLVIYLVVFTLFSVIFAIIFEEYKEIRTKIAIKDKVVQRQSLAEAFNYLDRDKKGWISYKFVVPILKFVSPKESPNDLMNLCRIIDKDGNGQISLEEFFSLIDVCTAQPTKKEKKKEKKKTRTTAQKVITSTFFKGLFNIAIIGNIITFLVLVIGKWTQEQKDIMWYVIYSFTLFMVLELFVKMLIFGFFGFWRKGWNLFSGVCVIIAGISQIIYVIFDDNEEVEFIFGALACFTVMRGILVFKTAKTMASTLFTVFPVITSMLCVCLSLMYFFAVIGMEVFYGVKAPHVSFNSFANAMFVVFVLLVGHNWLLILWAYMDWHVASAVYFCILTLVFNIIFLALMVALIIEMYVFVQELKKERKLKSKKNNKHERIKLERYIIKQLRGKSIIPFINDEYMAFDKDDINMDKK